MYAEKNAWKPEWATLYAIKQLWPSDTEWKETALAEHWEEDKKSFNGNDDTNSKLVKVANNEAKLVILFIDDTGGHAHLTRSLLGILSDLKATQDVSADAC